MAIINFNSISGITSITATGTIVAGSAFIKDKVVGLGTITTTERNSGVGTAVGSLIYNETLGVLEIYKRNSGWVAIGTVGDNRGPSGLTATGGVISDYEATSAGITTVYRAHIFTTSGTFTVSALSPSLPNNVEYLVVAGGGGGGSAGGGGGAGGFRTNVPGTTHSTSVTFPVSTSPGSYTVTVGAGGAGSPGPGIAGIPGVDSSFGPITSNGGGGGGTGSATAATNSGAGGSGGGVGRDVPNGTNGGSSTSVTTPSPWPGPSTQGFAGGGISGLPTPVGGYTGGGGGGAGGAGVNGGRYDISNPPTYSQGGAGLPLSITGITTHYAGGGGGGVYPGPNIPPAISISGGIGGGGSGGNSDGISNNQIATRGTYATGSAGGGGGGPSGGYSGPGGTGANGGSGIVVVRYQIGQLTAAQKATGGSISYYNGKTIHTFTTSGTFTALPSFNETVEYVVIGGGGGAGGGLGGGGGAGGYRTSTTPISGPSATSIQVGAGGAGWFGAPSNSGALPAPTGNGGDSYFGTPLTAKGGGAGAGYPGNGNASSDPNGGSGGGGSGVTASSGGSGGTYGNSGAAGEPGGNRRGGGGGGSGGAGTAASSGAHGGLGTQLPTTFRNPTSTVGAPGPSGSYWVAGGGGGGGDASGGSGGGPGGPYAGAGPGGSGVPAGTSALQNTGSGGGGGGNGTNGSNGGSGIVLIAYPS